MANEITVTGSLKLTNGNDSLSKTFSFNADQSAVGGPSPGTLSIGTTHEAVATTDVTNKGWAFFKNLDTVNFVDIGVDVAATFYPVLRLEPGESTVVRLSPAVALYAKADTAACRLESQILEA